MSSPDLAKMWEHSQKVKATVASVFKAKPQTYRDYRLLVFEVWKRYGVRFSYNFRTGELDMKFKSWDHQRQLPAANTIIRRAQEIKSKDREREAQGLPALFKPKTGDDSKAIMLEGAYHDYFGEIGRQNRLSDYGGY